MGRRNGQKLRKTPPAVPCSGWWARTNKSGEAMDYGRLAREETTLSPASCPGSLAPAHPREGTTLQPGAFAQLSEVSAFSRSEAGAWNRCTQPDLLWQLL